MITAGVDVGLENIKVVILKDGQVAARSSALSGGANRGRAVEQAWNDALKNSNLSSSDMIKVVSTGQGKLDVNFANDRVVESVADARAARFIYPSSTSVVDIGADQLRVVRLGKGKQMLEVVLNQKCAAGLGIFLKFMTRRLGMTLDEMSRLSTNGQNETVVNDGCSVFSELDALELLNRNVPREEVARAIIEAVAVRINSVLNDKAVPAKDSTVLIGGVSQNVAVVKALCKRSGIDFLIPDHAQYAGAMGAALVAAG